ncbi:hypothetical protein [Microbispora sp. NBRC 16548]|uniref:hypothetical protein n=1 Tax=Microbispora sp. NBRC 16548 TaxID=3030994 RepID=UPI0024A3F2C8|nr:hypothetical protein [Microbispora sp. NBRC 16548]GLX06666.1 hypothetical protein Misp03_35930 [Microbispora sp. NBRC 16548]
MDRIAVFIGSVLLLIASVAYFRQVMGRDAGGGNKTSHKAEPRQRATANEKASPGIRVGRSGAAADQRPAGEPAAEPNEGEPRPLPIEVTLERHEEPHPGPWPPKGSDTSKPLGERRPELDPAPASEGPDLMRKLRDLARRREPPAARYKKPRAVSRTTTFRRVPIAEVDEHASPDQHPRRGLPAQEKAAAVEKVIQEFAEEVMIPPHLLVPKATMMRNIVSFIREGLVRLVRLPDGRDIRTPLAKGYAYAQVYADAADGLGLLRDHLIENRHDPQVIAAYEEAAAAARHCAEIVKGAAQTASGRYQGTASDQARGVRLPDMHDS